MKATLFVLVVVSLLFRCTPTSAQTPFAKLSVSSSSVDFGDRDIGTATPADNPLILRNDTDSAVTLSVTSSGPNSDDFQTDNKTCGDKIPAKGQCEIKVVFSPRMAMDKDTGVLSPNPIERKKTLEVKGGSETHEIQLTGRAFQNLAASPSIVELAIQRWSSAPAPRPLLVTNDTDSQLESLAVTVTGNFTEDHSGCVNVKPGDSCVIYVAYPPKQSAAAQGSLAFSGTLAATPAGPKPPETQTNQNPAPPKTNPSPAPVFLRLTRGVVLHGTISSGWHWWRFDVGTWFLFGMAGIYFLSLVGVRWHMIAKPARAELVAEIRAIRARVASESAWLPESPQKKVQLFEINHLLDIALYPFQYPHFLDPGGRAAADQSWWSRIIGPRAPDQLVLPANQRNNPAAVVPTRPYPRWGTRVFDALFWTRGSDLAGWTLAHEVERQFVQLLPLQPVWARLEIAEQELRVLNTPVTLALADRIHQSLTSGEALILERARALLQKAQSILKPLSVPEAARLAWLADLRKRTSDFLLSLADWISKNNTADADQSKRHTQLNDFSKLAENGGQLASEGSELEKSLADSDSSKQLLQEISAFFKDFAAAAQPIQQASGNSTIDQGTCNTLLGSLKNLGDRAKALADKLNLTPLEQTKPFKDLLDLCKAQVALVAEITKATTPSTGLSLLRDILKHLQDENDLVQHIDQANDASSIGKCREDVKELAALTLLPADQMKRIESALSDPVPETLGRWQALLAEAMVLIDGDVDDRFYKITGWHNKLIWLVVCSLLFLVALGLAFENGVLLLVGAVGGLLSRLQRTIEQADVATDYGATWGALFLSPLTGALTAWGGILLIVLGVKLNIFGAALNLDWNDPYNPTALALALVFGFSERWFSGLIDTVQSKVVAPAGSTSTSTTTPAPTPPALKITSTDPKTASAAKENKVKLVGTNFQAGATVAVTDSAGTVIPATVDPNRDTTTMMVTFTPPNKGTVTVTVTNPDKQTIACKLDVT